MGVTGAAKQADPEAVVTLYTDYEDAAYSPCGIPYVHGGEIPNFERLFLQGKEFYEQKYRALQIRLLTKKATELGLQLVQSA